MTRTEALAGTTRATRALLPAWLLRMLRPAPLPLDWTRIVAAALGIGGPTLVGLGVGKLDEAVLVSLGALCASFSDLTGSYRYRIRRVGLTVLSGGFGFAVGVVAPSPLWAAAVVVAVAVPSVLASRVNDLCAAAGAQMLTFCVVATGHVTTGVPVGEQIGWFVAGEVLLLALVAATWPFRRAAPARGAVARVFDALLKLFDAAGTDAAINARQELTRALNNAHDILVGGASISRSRVHDRLYVVLTRATPVVEASVALAHARIRPTDRTLDAMRSIARCVRDGGTVPPYRPATSGSIMVHALDQGLTDLIDSWRRAKRADVPDFRARLGTWERLRLWRSDISIGRTGWLLTLRMVLCLAVAEGIGIALQFQNSYWIAMTVALVLKPNSGSVFARTVLRGIGSLVGVVVAGALLLAVPPGWGLALVTVLVAAFVPEALSRHYGLFTMVVTTIVLLQMHQSDLFADQLPRVRLVDSLLGCVLVLVVGYLMWPPGRSPALAGRLADAVDTVSEYVSLSMAGRVQGRSALRRRTYRELSDLRTALQQQLMEPAAVGRAAEVWWPSIIVLERLVDAATERALLIERGGDDLRLEHTQRIVSTLRTAARQLRIQPDAPAHNLRNKLTDVYTEVVS
ncbi:MULTISPECIES: FUSC family protein [unclassified Saccharopolyspora]|uniref:FUSC family protein n=1 Tax=unclassified Saccharopolyspora TaxID=2646250 RepID=UPI001CD4665C|nr:MULTISPECIES: FUSC family protein [unclassified Saccharopolyspora]MCA1189728.1 FUSC family protein [Saccharopolyspora sp. 6T]MCA1226165.1 FUSC family protein [Saccharopolyspora sp. 6M]MCA1281449.1 FUSC family protein [Saccharopolyspora sp. 7B]